MAAEAPLMPGNLHRLLDLLGVAKLGMTYELDMKLTGYGLRLNRFLPYCDLLFVVLGYALVLNDYL